MNTKKRKKLMNYSFVYVYFPHLPVREEKTRL